MKTFAQLFEERRGILDNGAYVRSKAAEVFNGTKLLLREGLPSAPNDGALLGIAFYSLPDLAVLDEVVERSRNSSHARNMQVEIFDVLVFKSMQDAEALFHTPVYGTPMIGIWAKGELIQKGWGVRDAQRISRALFT
jgi:hypothetical protein